MKGCFPFLPSHLDFPRGTLDSYVMVDVSMPASALFHRLGPQSRRFYPAETLFPASQFPFQACADFLFPFYEG